MLDTVFILAGEAIENLGEDSFCSSQRDGRIMIGVFDGCGGMGGREYEGMQNHSGAYLASRLASGAVYDWFRSVDEDEWRTGETLICSMKAFLQKAFDLCRPYLNDRRKIKGSLIKTLPTTGAIAVAEEVLSDTWRLHLVWAGDSRIYLLDEEGLHQLSADDARTQDALLNLENDSPMTNVIFADGNYHMHYACIKRNEPFAVMTATDGCFGYYPTPMHFEYVILDCLINSNTPVDFQCRLKKEFKGAAGDDFTLGFMCFGFETFQNLKGRFMQRHVFMEEKYIRCIGASLDEDVIQSLWKQYKSGYESFMSKENSSENDERKS